MNKGSAGGKPTQRSDVKNYDTEQTEPFLDLPNTYPVRSEYWRYKNINNDFADYTDRKWESCFEDLLIAY